MTCGSAGLGLRRPLARSSFVVGTFHTHTAPPLVAAAILSPSGDQSIANAIPDSFGGIPRKYAFDAATGIALAPWCPSDSRCALEEGTPTSSTVHASTRPSPSATARAPRHPGSDCDSGDHLRSHVNAPSCAMPRTHRASLPVSAVFGFRLRFAPVSSSSGKAGPMRQICTTPSPEARPRSSNDEAWRCDRARCSSVSVSVASSAPFASTARYAPPPSSVGRVGHQSMRQTAPPANAAMSSTTRTSHESTGASDTTSLLNLGMDTVVTPSSGDHAGDFSAKRSNLPSAMGDATVPRAIGVTNPRRFHWTRAPK